MLSSFYVSLSGMPLFAWSYPGQTAISDVIYRKVFLVKLILSERQSKTFFLLKNYFHHIGHQIDNFFSYPVVHPPATI
ncbi:MAG TPA: hypothetical protein DHV36_09505 [Desulfobacteraceae bacterium]|nr:hypothetical protein [Desulfobacteraceae bacterium]